MLSIAIGFSIILWVAILLISVFSPLSNLLPFFTRFNPLVNFLISPIGFSITVLIIFLLLRFTAVYQYLKPSRPIQIIFGISNTLIIGSYTLVSQAMQKDGAIGVILVLSPFIALNVILLLYFTGDLIAQAYQKLNEQSPSGVKEKAKSQINIFRWELLNIAIAFSFLLWCVTIFIAVFTRSIFLVNLAVSPITSAILVISFYIWLSMTKVYERFKLNKYIQIIFLIFNVVAIIIYLKRVTIINLLAIVNEIIKIALPLGLIIVLVRMGFLIVKIYRKSKG